MSDCTTNHAHLIKLEGELHPSGKDYYCTDCGDVFEVEIKPAEIGVGYGQPGKDSPSWWKDEGYVCASLHRVGIDGCVDCEEHSKCGIACGVIGCKCSCHIGPNEAQQPQGETKP